MSIPPSTDPRLTQQELRSCLKQRTRIHPEPFQVYVFWVINVGGDMEVTGFSKVSKVKSNLFLQTLGTSVVSLSSQRLAALTPKLWGGDRPISLWI